MIAYHLSVFAQNRPGRLEHLTKILADAGINVRAFKVSDLGEYGLIKALVDDPDAASRALDAAGMTVSKKPIVAIDVEDRPGGLHRVFRMLTDRQINVEDAYGFAVKNRAVLVVEVADTHAAMALFETSGLRLLTEKEIYAL